MITTPFYKIRFSAIFGYFKINRNTMLYRIKEQRRPAVLQGAVFFYTRFSQRITNLVEQVTSNEMT